MNITEAYNITRPLGHAAIMDHVEMESAIVDYVVGRWAYRSVEDVAQAIGSALEITNRGGDMNMALDCARNVMRRN